jgi:hypothetical protein
MAKERRLVAVHTFKGGRFDDHGLDLDVLVDLTRYKTILVETAKELWRRAHPDSGRLPNNFEDSLTLRFYRLEPGSTAIPLEREIERDPAMLFPIEPDELDAAAELVSDAVAAVAEDRTLPNEFPKRLISLFGDYGRSLRADEWIEQRPARRRNASRYDEVARARFQTRASSAYEDLVDVIGEVAMARVTKPRMALLLRDGREIEAPFDATNEDDITTALKQHRQAKLRVEGRGQFSPDGQLDKIIQVTKVTLLPCGEIPYHVDARPIWEEFQDLASQLPDELLRRLPNDGAEQHDHYVYGTNKRRA